MRRRLLVTAVTVWGAVSMASTTSAQEGSWYQDRTTNGCIFFIDYDPSDYPGWTTRWSGNCTSGQPIDGQGTLEETGPNVDAPGETKMIRKVGRMVGGYWHGSVTESRFTTENGGPMKQTSFSFERWYPTLESEFNMGCRVGSSGCTPGVVMAANDSSEMAWENGPPRNEIPDDYEPSPNLIESSNPPGFGEPATASGGGRRSFINPETGDYCLQEQSTAPKVVTVYFQHSITLSNSCGQAIRVVITEEPDNRPTGRSYTGSVGANRTDSFSCLQANPNGSAAGMAGCAGFQGWDYAE